MASRLAATQNQLGIRAEVIADISGSLRDSPLQNPLHTLAAASDQYLLRAPGFSAPISMLRDRLGNVSAESIRNADVIHVHWPHGLVRIDDIARVAAGRPVVWTLHDMASFTGVCHYSLGCHGFEAGCVQCPAVRGFFRSESARALQRKRRSVSLIERLQVVAPSAWLAAEARRSLVFGDHRIDVIPNPLPEVPQIKGSVEDAKATWGFSDEDTVFAVVAASIDDPLKGVEAALHQFQQVHVEHPASRMLVVGHSSTNRSVDGVVFTGAVASDELRRVYAAADYLIVNSQAENQPLVISEAQAHGVSLIAANHTGLPEHLDIDPEGEVFDDPGRLKVIITDRIGRTRRSSERARLAKAAAKKFDPLAIAQRYIELYDAVR